MGMHRDALDCILSLALSLHKKSPLTFNAYFPFVLFSRLLLRPLPNRCQGRFANALLRRRCEIFNAGDIQRSITDSHEAQSDKVTTTMNSTSSDSITFSKTAKASFLAAAWELIRACKVAFTYGLETDPWVAAKFIKKAHPIGTLCSRSPIHL